LFRDQDFATQRAFFAARPDLAPTPLHSLPALAQKLGIRELLIKDETSRFGLNAFKAAGALFAIETLRTRGDMQPGATLVCASEGNHGRAVARAAHTSGCHARVYMAESAAASRVAAIESEGAAVVRVPGTYDEAVREMGKDAAANGWTIISDTSLVGDEEIPRLIMLGYTRLLDEAEAAWQPADRPDVMFVQGGVGGLLAAVACWAEWRFGAERPLIAAVEPSSAACLQESARHGRPRTLAGPFDTVMAGLRCGEASPVAFRAVKTLVDAYIAIEDDWTRDAIRLLATPERTDPMIRAGASGAAALGGLMAAMRAPAAAHVKRRLSLDGESRVLVMVTEGVTDADLFTEVVGSHPTGRA
jgi:diaminopropionate ammonia-lyase